MTRMLANSWDRRIFKPEEIVFGDDEVPSVDEGHIDPAAISPADYEAQTLKTVFFEKALAELPPLERAVIGRAYFQGNSQRNISREFGDTSVVRTMPPEKIQQKIADAVAFMQSSILKQMNAAKISAEEINFRFA